MYHSIEAIVLRLVRHNDKHSIVRLYTPALGVIGCVTPAGDSREARRRRALMTPLATLRCVVSMTQGSDLHHLRDVQPLDMSAASILTSPVKGALAQFLAELFDATLREQQPDALLYDFVAHTARELSAIGGGVANYHLLVLLRLGHFQGIEPDWGSYRRGYWLDESDGTFRPVPPMHEHFADPRESRVLYLLHSLPADKLSRLRLSARDRNYIIDRILAYYRLHEVNTGPLHSLEVLRQLF
ncbi:MAG: recombination protein O N-terminal domain-containing protein [Muribaculaceae bacterium]|nr:recombination protein O N-terminal domain-containing protein [Muribaculaceae bacterium]